MQKGLSCVAAQTVTDYKNPPKNMVNVAAVSLCQVVLRCLQHQICPSHLA